MTKELEVKREENNYIQGFTPDQISKILAEITEKHKTVSGIKTPVVEIKKKPGGGGSLRDYVEAQYMKRKADELYPGWNWEIIKFELLGDTACVIHGRLTWYEVTSNGVLKRTGDSIAAHRIQKGKTTGSYVDIGNDIKAANTDTLKKAFSLYMNIADDVYRYEGNELSQEQVERLHELSKKINEAKYQEVDRLIVEGKIHKINYQNTIKKLEELVKFS